MTTDRTRTVSINSNTSIEDNINNMGDSPEKDTGKVSFQDFKGGDHKERTFSSSSDDNGELSGKRIAYGRRRALSTPGVMGRTIVLCLDASDNAKMAFEWYLDQIRRPTDFIVLVHIPEPPRLPTFSFKSGMAPPVEEWKTILDDMNERTRKLEEDYEGTCIQRKLRYKMRGEAMKNPGEGIVKVADEEHAELICMGTRGLSGIKRALVGSVSDYVSQHASCPTILVPAKKIIERRASLLRTSSIPEAQ